MSHTDDVIRHTSRSALAALDRAISHKPRHDGHDFSHATRCLSEFRDALVAERRRDETPEATARLGRLNAVISVVLGGHFPIGEVPWTHVETARAALAELVASVA